MVEMFNPLEHDMQGESPTKICDDFYQEENGFYYQEVSSSEENINPIIENL